MTQLLLTRPASPRARLDFVIRHPRFDTSLNPHAHRSTMPFWTSAHNFYLEILSEIGVVGLFSHVPLVGAILLETRRALDRAIASHRRTATAAALGIFALMVASLAQDPLTVREV